VYVNKILARFNFVYMLYLHSFAADFFNS